MSKLGKKASKARQGLTGKKHFEVSEAVVFLKGKQCHQV